MLSAHFWNPPKYMILLLLLFVIYYFNNFDCYSRLAPNFNFHITSISFWGLYLLSDSNNIIKMRRSCHNRVFILYEKTKKICVTAGTANFSYPRTYV